MPCPLPGDLFLICITTVSEGPHHALPVLPGSLTQSEHEAAVN